MHFLLIDDHSLFRLGLKHILTSLFPQAMFSESGSFAEAKKSLETTAFDFILIDVNIGDENGIQLLKWFKQQQKTGKCIVLSMYEDSWIIKESMQLGADAYLTKDAQAQEFELAIEKISSGKKYVSQAAAIALTNLDQSLFESMQFVSEDLTPAEKRILKMVSESKSSKEIASILGLHHRTVENHRTNICSKLNLTGANALVKYAIANKERLAQAI